MPEEADPPDEAAVAAPDPDASGDDVTVPEPDADDAAAPEPDERTDDAPAPLTREDLGGNRLGIANDKLGPLVLVAAAILMAGFVLGRVSAPDGVVDTTTTTIPEVVFPAGDSDRSGYWQFAGITPAVVDTFDRADADDLGSADTGEEWSTASGSWAVVNEQAASTDARARPAIAVIEGGTANRLTEASMMVVESGAGIVFRYRDPQNYWAMTADPEVGSWIITRVADGQDSVIAEVAGATADGTAIGVAQRGPELQILVDGQERTRITDPTLSGQARSGLISPAGAAGDARWDRFYVGNIAPSG